MSKINQAGSPADREASGTPQRFDPGGSYDLRNPSQLQAQTVNQSRSAPGLLVRARPSEEMTWTEFVLHDVRTSDGPPPKECKMAEAGDSKKKKVPLTDEQQDELIKQRLRKIGLLDPEPYHDGQRPSKPVNMHNSGARTKPPHWKEGSSHTTEFPKRITSWMKNIATKARANQESPFADNDSGYRSGRETPSTHYRDSVMSQVSHLSHMSEMSQFSLFSQLESPTELERPYRIVCHTLHEPLFPNMYRETPPCTECRYSNTHNLAAIGKNLALKEFRDELRLDFYMIKDIDAAGNSALHYAAAFGVSYAHLNALIDAGVPPDQLNTANQNFLHCLRLPEVCNVGFDDSNLKSATSNLVTLLNRLDLKIIGQQDNDGQTVLHALASHINEPELRDEIFK
jgi:hypothetical protein